MRARALTHRVHDFPGLPGIPICWVHEAVERGTPVDEQADLWAISVDHEALPPFYACGRNEYVNCQPCRELIHA